MSVVSLRSTMTLPSLFALSNVANRINGNSTFYILRSHLRPLPSSGYLETEYATAEESWAMCPHGPVACHDDHVDSEDHLDQVRQPPDSGRSIRCQPHHLVGQRRAVPRHHNGMHPAAAPDQEDRIRELPQRQLVVGQICEQVGSNQEHGELVPSRQIRPPHVLRLGSHHYSE